MSAADAEVVVSVTLRGRVATIEDVAEALAVLTAEGIPESFEVSISQRADREYAPELPYDQRKVEHVFTVSASRAAKSGATS